MAKKVNKRVHIEETDDGGFIVRTTTDDKDGFHEETRIAKSFNEAMRKLKKQFNEGNVI